MTATTENRQKAITTRTIRRLSETDLVSLATAMDSLTAVEELLLRNVSALREAAQKELRLRQVAGLPGVGPFGEAQYAAMALLRAVTSAVDETTLTYKTRIRAR